MLRLLCGGFEDRLTVTRHLIVSEEGEVELHSRVSLMLSLIGDILCTFLGQYF